MILPWPPIIPSLGSEIDRPRAEILLRRTFRGLWWRSSDQFCKAAKVLRNGCERELILSTAWAAQPKPAKPQNAFEMGKQHLNALAAATRLLESLGLGQCASDIAGVLMQIAR